MSHDGAPPSYCCEVLQWLLEIYLGRWIDRVSEAQFSCPACSLDFNPLEFVFCGGILKARYMPIQTILERKFCIAFNNVASEINNTTRIFESLLVYISRRFELHVRKYGGHFEQNFT